MQEPCAPRPSRDARPALGGAGRGRWPATRRLKDRCERRTLRLTGDGRDHDRGSRGALSSASPSRPNADSRRGGQEVEDENGHLRPIPEQVYRVLALFLVHPPSRRDWPPSRCRNRHPDWVGTAKSNAPPARQSRTSTGARRRRSPDLAAAPGEVRSARSSDPTHAHHGLQQPLTARAPPSKASGLRQIKPRQAGPITDHRRGAIVGTVEGELVPGHAGVGGQVVESLPHMTGKFWHVVAVPLNQRQRALQARPRRCRMSFRFATCRNPTSNVREGWALVSSGRRAQRGQYSRRQSRMAGIGASSSRGRSCKSQRCSTLALTEINHNHVLTRTRDQTNKTLHQTSQSERQQKIGRKAVTSESGGERHRSPVSSARCLLSGPQTAPP